MALFSKRSDKQTQHVFILAKSGPSYAGRNIKPVWNCSLSPSFAGADQSPISSNGGRETWLLAGQEPKVWRLGFKCFLLSFGGLFRGIFVYRAQAGPPCFEFSVIFDFLNHGIEKVDWHLVCKLNKKFKGNLVKCANELACLYWPGDSTQNCKLNWPSRMLRMLSRHWI